VGPPEDYVVITAARYLRVPPWTLLDAPIRWIELAYASMQMDADASAGATVRAKRGKASP
jgi:hypothetical protein